MTEPVPSMLQTETAGPCHALDCPSNNTRRYINGAYCDPHSPWAVAGRNAPTGGDQGQWITGTRPTPAFTRLDFEGKKYVSKQRAVKIAEQRDAIRNAS